MTERALETTNDICANPAKNVLSVGTPNRWLRAPISFAVDFSGLMSWACVVNAQRSFGSQADNTSQAQSDDTYKTLGGHAWRAFPAL